MVTNVIEKYFEKLPSLIFTHAALLKKLSFVHFINDFTLLVSKSHKIGVGFT